MKGFLSFLGITVIVSAFGLILLSFFENPLEDFQKEERLQAYMEMRDIAGQQAKSAVTTSWEAVSTASFQPVLWSADFEASCGQP